MTVTNPRVNRILTTAEMCLAFRCLPSELRKEDKKDLQLIAYSVLELEKQSNPAFHLLKGMSKNQPSV